MLTEERRLELQERLDKVITCLYTRERLYGFIALTRKHVITESVRTAATDGKTVYWNPDFLYGLTNAQIRVCLKHEFWHVLKLDHARMGKRNRDLWNVATDKVINYMLHNEEYETIPEGFLYDRSVEGKDSEQVYEEEADWVRERAGKEANVDPGTSARAGPGEQPKAAPPESPDNAPSREKQTAPAPASSDGLDQAGEEKEESPDNGFSSDEDQSRREQAEREAFERIAKEQHEVACGVEVIEPEEEDRGPQAEERERVHRQAQEALRQAAKAGHLGEALERRVKAVLSPEPTAREYLYRFLENAVTRDDFSWKRPNKRYEDVYIPSLRSETVDRLAVILDTSGSISDRMLSDFVGDVQDLLETLGADAVLDLIYVDSVVAGTQEVTLGEVTAIKPMRVTGATRFTPGFKWIAESGTSYRGVLYYTDGYANDFPGARLDPGCPALWVLHQEHSANLDGFRKALKFGEAVKMNNRKKTTY